MAYRHSSDLFCVDAIVVESIAGKTFFRKTRASLKIGVVTTSYPRDENDYAGIFVKEHVEWMRGEGHDVDVIACGNGPGAHRVGGKLFEGEGAPDRLERNAALYVDAFKTTLRLRKAVKRQSESWDAIVTHWLVPSALCAALSTRLPITAIAHSGDVHLIKKLKIGALLAPLWERRVTQIVFVSESLKETFLQSVGRSAQQLESKCIVSPMGIHTDRFRCAKNEKLKNIVLCVARLVEIKGVDRLIAAAKHLDSDTEVWIAGDGPLRSKLELAASSNVRFLGQVSPNDRYGLFKHAKVVVVPSLELSGRREGAPMVIREALAASAQVIVSNEILGTGCYQGIASVEAGIPLKLANKINEALEKKKSEFLEISAMDWSLVGPILLPFQGAEKSTHSVVIP